jgi:hypothetical protein
MPTTSHPADLDALTDLLTGDGWTRQPDLLPGPFFGGSFCHLTHPGHDLEIHAMTLVAPFGGQSLTVELRPHVAYGEPPWRIGLANHPASVLLAVTRAATDTPDPRSATDRLADAGWTLTDEHRKGSKTSYQRWTSPDGERVARWALPGRSIRDHGGWMITRPGPVPPWSDAHAPLNAPPAVIAAAALTDPGSSAPAVTTDTGN